MLISAGRVTTYLLLALLLLVGDCVAPKKPEELPSLPQPHPTDHIKCPPGKVSRGVYCLNKGRGNVYHKACARVIIIKGEHTMPRATTSREPHQCPGKYVCVPHGAVRVKGDLWNPFTEPPESEPRIDCVSPAEKLRRRAIAEGVRDSLPDRQINNMMLKRRRHNPAGEDGAGPSGTAPQDNSASISGTRPVHLAPVPGSPGVYAEFEDIIENYELTLTHADVTAMMLDAENEMLQTGVRSIEGFLNGEQVCTAAVQTEDVPSSVCMPTRTVDIHAHDRIEFTIDLSDAPSVDQQLLWDALGQANDKVP